MDSKIFKDIFGKVSENILSLGIKKGYFQIEKEAELQNKLIEISNNEITELDDSQGLAFFNPNLNKLGFNLNQIKTEEEAIILTFHELKHIFDQYFDYNNEQHINEHIGFHQQYSDFGIGQNESITERFAMNMMEEFTGNKRANTSYDSLNLNFKTDMVRYQIEDRLNQLFCDSVGIELDDLISMQNDESMDRLNSLILKFNQGADYERYFAALDGIYKLRYGIDSKENESDFTDDEIRQIHEYIQLAQDEFEKFIKFRNPEDIDKLKRNFIMTDSRYKISEEQKEKLVSQIHPIRRQKSNESFLTDMFNMMRMDLLESGIKASELVTNTGEITNQQQIIIQENDKTKNKEMLQ